MTHEKNGSIEQILPQQMREKLETARHTVGQFDDVTRQFVRERPVVALLAAIGLGYVVARLASRL